MINKIKDFFKDYWILCVAFLFLVIVCSIFIPICIKEADETNKHNSSINFDNYYCFMDTGAWGDIDYFIVYDCSYCEEHKVEISFEEFKYFNEVLK